MIGFNIQMKYEYIPNKTQKIKTLYERTIAYAADRMEIEAKAKVPVRTGRLQNSIRQWVIPDGRAMGPNTPYDIYVEFGTSRMKAQPYIRPSIDNTKKLISQFMMRQYKTVMKEKKMRKV